MNRRDFILCKYCMLKHVSPKRKKIPPTLLNILFLSDNGVGHEHVGALFNNDNKNRPRLYSDLKM